MILSPAEARQVRAMDSDEIVAAMAEESRMEHGGWSVDQACDVLLARVALERAVDEALAEEGA